MRKKQFLLLMLVTLLSLSLFSACADEALDAHGTGEITDLVYSKNTYNILEEVFNSNLTGTGKGYNGDYIHQEIITDYSRYSDLLTQIRDNVARFAENGAYAVTVNGAANELPDQFPKKLELIHSIDEVLFENYDLLMVDIALCDTVQLEVEPQRISISDGCATVHMNYSIVVTSSADNCGALYFFRIPKGCTDAAIDLVLNVEDSILQAGPGL